MGEQEIVNEHGNGSAMRVSAAGWLYDSAERTREGCEDVVRNAVSLGGDTDTLAAIAGTMAETFCGIPEGILDAGRNFLKPDMRKLCGEFSKRMG